MPGPGSVRLTVHNILGEELATVVDATLAAGAHTAYFNAAGLASGVYLIRLRAGNDVAIIRAVLTR